MEHFELFGGKFFAKREAQKRLLALAGRQTTLDRQDLELLLNGLLERADGKRTLEWAGDHTITGDWKIAPYERWVDDTGIAAIICFGNLTIEGDLLNDHPNYSPLLIVAGDLRVRNLLKGGLPLFVFGNLVASGYFVTDYNDGPLRVGGDLVAAGYMPRCRDYPEAKGHRNRIVALVCEGDLTIDGDVLNRELDSGPMLLVGGKLRVRNLIKGGSRVIVIGNLEASGLVVCEYNHGVFRVGGDLSAQVYFVLDQSCWVCGAIHAPVLNDRDVDMREEVVPELFPTEDDAEPNVDWLWGRQRAGLPILKAEAEP